MTGVQTCALPISSGHTTQAAAVIGLLLGWVTKRGELHGYISLSTAIVSWFALSLLAGAARVWLGVHYPTDIVVGIGLGGLIALISLKIYQFRYANQKRLVESKRLWLLLLVVYFFGTLQLLQPLYVFSWFAALGLFIALAVRSDQSETLKFNPWQQVIASIVGVAVIAGTSLSLVSPATTSIVLLAVNALAILIGMLWILIGAPYLTRRFKRE